MHNANKKNRSEIIPVHIEILSYLHFCMSIKQCCHEPNPVDIFFPILQFNIPFYSFGRVCILASCSIFQWGQSEWGDFQRSQTFTCCKCEKTIVINSMLSLRLGDMISHDSIYHPTKYLIKAY